MSYILDTDKKFSFISVGKFKKFEISLLKKFGLSQKLSDRKIKIVIIIIGKIFRSVEKEKFNFSFEARDAI